MIRTALIGVAIGLLALSARAEPIAMICQLTGKVEVSRGAGGWTNARLLQKLDKGDQIRCLGGGQVGIVMVGAGQRFLLSAGQTGRVADASVDGARAIAGLRAPSLEASNKLKDLTVGASGARPGYSSLAVDLETRFEGWKPMSTTRFRWKSRSLFQGIAVSAFNFSLMDGDGYIIWSAHTRTDEAAADDLPALKTRAPYIWRLDALNEKGGPAGPFRWGIITFLDENEAKQLTLDTADLTRQIEAHPEDTTLIVMLAEKYRQFGVHMHALDLLLKLEGGTESVEGAQDELYREVGRFAVFCKGLPLAKEETRR